jgi:type IV secretory pathway VirD2 relaxase
MPSPTPADKVLAAARKFAREKFALQHRYAMVLHTDQQHPHVHVVVKAESEEGRRLHIDKAMLRAWRDDFARLMREQGVAANATPRVIRGRNKGKTRDAITTRDSAAHRTSFANA